MIGRSVRILTVAGAILAGGLGYAAGNAHLLAPEHAVAADECATFAETGKLVCGRFLVYWRDHGGVAQQGLPLSDAFIEIGDTDGQPRTVQYFERAVFELHPENAPPYDVLLSLLGRERYLTKYRGGAEAPSPAPIGVAFVEVVGSYPNGTARVTVRSAPGTPCSIRYITPLGNLSVAGGLGPKPAGADGLVTWTWKIGANTSPGTGEVIVTCGDTTITAPITITR